MTESTRAFYSERPQPIITAPQSFPTELNFDVTRAVGAKETLNQRAWLFAPPPTTQPSAILICLPGAGYDKRYWHMHVPGYPHYSFADYFAGRGYITVAVDHLGVGDSTDPVTDGPVTSVMLARGNAEVIKQVGARASGQSLHPSLPPLSVPIVGIGHSFGAGLAVISQADDDTGILAALVLLGFSMHHTENAHAALEQAATTADLRSALREAIARNEALVRSMTGTRDYELFCTIPRGPLSEMLYASDVPSEVVAADAKRGSRIPVRALAEVMTPGIVGHDAARIAVPLFLGFGGHRDLSPSPHSEAQHYPAATDITVYLADGAAHAHNLSSNRAVLWGRIASWLSAVAK
jgi:alpha-beta hydrolase superfamily lysophospholipase